MDKKLEVVKWKFTELRKQIEKWHNYLRNRLNYKLVKGE